MKDLKGKKVIVRGVNSGVYFGTLVDRDGQCVELSDVRNIWRWRGANNLTDIAKGGLPKNDFTRITQSVDSVIFTDICEIIECSDISIKSLEEYTIWN